MDAGEVERGGVAGAAELLELDERSLRRGPVAGHRVADAQGALHERAAARKCRGLLELRERLGEPALLQQRAAEVPVGDSEVGMELDRLAAFLDRLVVPDRKSGV